MSSKRKPQKPRRTRAQPARKSISLPKLATIATLIGIATGMVALRDAIFPRDSSTGAPAGAINAGSPYVAGSPYAADIGEICDALNVVHERSRSARLALKRKLQAARTTGRQRDLLMNNTEQIITGSSAVFVQFDAAVPPADLEALHRKTTATWNQTLESLREFRRQLSDKQTWGELNALLHRFNDRSSSRLAENAVTVRVGLTRLAHGQCELEPATPVGVFYVPDRDPEPAPTQRAQPPVVSPAPSTQPPAEVPAQPTPAPAPAPLPDAPAVPDNAQPVPDDPQPDNPAAPVPDHSQPTNPAPPSSGGRDVIGVGPG